jgi:hypothetical protein
LFFGHRSLSSFTGISSSVWLGWLWLNIISLFCPVSRRESIPGRYCMIYRVGLFWQGVKQGFFDNLSIASAFTSQL